MPLDATQLGETLGILLSLAWLLPLAGFAIEIFGGFLWTRQSKAAAYLAVLCIGTAFLLSAGALLCWGQTTRWSALAAGEEHVVEEASLEAAAASEGAAHPGAEAPDGHPPAASHENPTEAAAHA